MEQLGKNLLQGALSTTATTISTEVYSGLAGWTSAGGVSGTELIKGAAQLNTQLGSLANNTQRLVGNLKTLTQTDMSNFGAELATAGSGIMEAGASVGKKYLQSKWERLQNLWETKTEIKIGTLIGEAAPYAKDPLKAASALAQKCQNLIAYLLDLDITTNSDTTWGEFGEILAQSAATDIANAYSTDAQFQQSINSLANVSGMGNILTSATQILAIAKTIMKIVDTVKPMLEVTSDLALTYWSGGTTTAKAAQSIKGIIQKTSVEVGKVILGILKKTLFELPVEVPVLVVQSVKILSVKEAVKTKSWDIPFLNEAFDFMFSNDFGKANQALSQWQSWMQTISQEGNSNNIWLYAQTYMAVAQDALLQIQRSNSSDNRGKYWYNVLSKNPSFTQLNEFFNSSSTGNYYLKLFTNNYTQAFMQGAVQEARTAAGTINYSYPDSEYYKNMDESIEDDEVISDSSADIIDQVLEAVTSVDISWTEATLRTVSKQIYDKI